MQDIESFPLLSTSGKDILTFELKNKIRSLKITGWRYHFSDLKVPEGIDPKSFPRGIQAPNGKARVGLFVAPLEGEPFDNIALFLAIEENPWLSEEKGPQLLFFGGFDPPSIALNHLNDTEFLAFAYPCSEFEQLKKFIGCIDLQMFNRMVDG